MTPVAAATWASRRNTARDRETGAVASEPRGHFVGSTRSRPAAPLGVLRAQVEGRRPSARHCGMRAETHGMRSAVIELQRLGLAPIAARTPVLNVVAAETKEKERMSAARGDEG